MRLSFVLASCLITSLGAGADQHIAKGLSSLSTEARASISAAMGRDDAAYQARARTGGFSVQNAQHDLSTDFTADGVDVHSGTAHYRMTLRGYGYGKAVMPLEAVAPSASANRIEYRRRRLTEWYLNGPFGLEQGFTIQKPPSKSHGQPLTIALALSTDLRATLEGDGHGLKLANGAGGQALRYTGLVAYDANRIELRAWMEVRGKQVLLKADDRKARYPVVIDPWVQVAKLTASDGQRGDGLGYSVSVSGTTVVVGGYANDHRGAAYVFERPSQGWKDMQQTAKLTASDGVAGDDFGVSVSMSSDTVLVGAPYAANQTGVAYVFVKPSHGWKDMTQTAKLIASDGQNGDNLSWSVSISGDTAVAGVPQRNGQLGAAYVFVKPKDGWVNMTQTAELTASDASNLWLTGWAVAVSRNTIVAGAIGAFGSEGAVYLYAMPPGGWQNMTQTAKLLAAHGILYDELGTSVAVSEDTVVAGAPHTSRGGHGAAYLFVMPKGGWKDMTQTARLVPRGAQEFGSSVAIYHDTAVIGMPLATVGTHQYQGAAFVFVKPNSGWKNTSKFKSRLTAFHGAENDRFGSAVSIDNQTIVAGVPGAVAYTGYGAVFELSSRSSIYVLDTDNHRVQTFDGNGVYQSQFDHSFDLPTGIALDAGNNVYVKDGNYHCQVDKFDSEGKYRLRFGACANHKIGRGIFDNIGMVAVDPGGNVWVTSPDFYYMQEFDNSGKFLGIVCMNNVGVPDCPQATPNPVQPDGIGFDSSGNIYVTDPVHAYDGPEVVKFDSKGVYLSSFGHGQLNEPTGIALDAGGNVYVADSGNNRIVKFDSNGFYLSEFGSRGIGNGQFMYPVGIAFDEGGDIYVADVNNNRVQEFNSSGIYKNQFGSYGSGNGQFYAPLGIAIRK